MELTDRQDLNTAEPGDQLSATQVMAQPGDTADSKTINNEMTLNNYSFGKTEGGENDKNVSTPTMGAQRGQTTDLTAVIAVRPNVEDDDLNQRDACETPTGMLEKGAAMENQMGTVSTKPGDDAS